jgi:hypothetical protein
MRIRARYRVWTLGLLAVAAAGLVLQSAPPRPAPAIQRPAQHAGRRTPPPRPITARGVLEGRAQLGLTASQAARLEVLDRDWSERNRDLDAALEAARQEVARHVESQPGGRTSLAELERRSADFQDLSAELRQRRRLHADATLEILTEPQRRQLVPATSPETAGESR